MLSLHELIKSCKKGKKESQYELVKRFSSQLMTVCRRYAHDEATAKDMLQESFIRIFSNIQKYKPSGSFEGWMYTITVRCSLQWIDKKHFKNEVFHHSVPERDLEPEIYSQLGMEDIILLIQELSPGQRAVFNLNVIDGYSHKEIAKMLNITESSSRSNLVRARQMLQSRINSIQLIKYRPA